MDLLYSILGFLVVVGVLVTVHEFGHFWVARRLGVRVLSFSIGFGKPLWMRRSRLDGTKYIIGAIPLGGYVKMLDEREGPVEKDELSRAFNRKPLSTRVAIVLAGPLCNLLFAVFAYWVMFIAGVSGIKPIVADVVSGSIADRAGLMPNDVILSVDGRIVRSWEFAVQAIIDESLEGKIIPAIARRESGFDVHLSLNLLSLSLDDLTGNKFFRAVGVYPPLPPRGTVIGWIDPDGAAKRAGLLKGDRVISAEGKTFSDWSEWRKFIRHRPEHTIKLWVERNGLPVTVVIRPDSIKAETGVIGFIGAAADHPTDKDLQVYRQQFYITESYSPLMAFRRALLETVNTSLLTVRMLWKVLTFEASIKNLSGPISIAEYAGAAVQIGAAKFLQLLAILSVSIGILNLLPIPMLDGGHLMYYFWEFVRGKPLSEEAQSIGSRFGITVLVGLMGIVFFNDLVRFFG